MTPLVKLQSSDGGEFSVEPKLARMSATVAGLMDAMGMTEGEDEEVYGKHVVPLPNVTKDVLQKVIEWCEYHKDDEPFVEQPDDGREKDTTVPEWDKNFFEIDFKLLTEVMKAANYLDIRKLFIEISKTIANMIKCKTAQAIRDKFNIYCDLTKEEEEKIRKENSWCDE
ncbi:hypothetical protein PMAYCL1PPCAC_20892 [Pristionchus mayeri]|uniref:Skp1-related protein n=1 Tax=Pristionchus mayeri TaxID=1317129 RepID=A0AAN5I3I2_9BILA|nr:hypothetical protein PMAYCL1PPCAC_20892 [Pristionchus mayeri]